MIEKKRKTTARGKWKSIYNMPLRKNNHVLDRSYKTNAQTINHFANIFVWASNLNHLATCVHRLYPHTNKHTHTHRNTHTRMYQHKTSYYLTYYWIFSFSFHSNVVRYGIVFKIVAWSTNYDVHVAKDHYVLLIITFVRKMNRYNSPRVKRERVLLIRKRNVINKSRLS